MVSWWTSATWLTSGWAASAASTSSGRTGVKMSDLTVWAGMPWARAIFSMRSPYTPLSTTSSARSAGTAEQIVASTAAVPEPVKSTVVQSVPQPASRVTSARQRRIMSKYSGSRWQRSGITSAARTVAVVLAGPGFRRIHSRSPIQRLTRS